MNRNTQVYGTDNIFVVDASIFPGMPSTNPSAYVVTVAERAADLIIALPQNTAIGAVSLSTPGVITLLRSNKNSMVSVVAFTIPVVKSVHRLINVPLAISTSLKWVSLLH